MDLELCCFATQLLGTVEINDGVAAWAQALGGLVAIGVAYYVGQLPAKHGREARKAEQIAFCTTLKRAADFAFGTYVEAMLAADTGDWIRFLSAIGPAAEAKTDGLILKALEEPLSHWPNGETYLATQMFAFSIRKVAALADRPIEVGKDQWDQSVALANARLRALDRAKTRLDDAIAAAVREIRSGKAHAALPSAGAGM